MEYRILFFWLILLKVDAHFETGCDGSVFKIANTTFTLSNETVDANTAESKCESIGGKLAVLKDDFYKEKLYEKYAIKYNNSDLRRVYIYYNNGTDNITRYSYSTSLTGSTFNSTKELGHLWYIDLFNRNETDAIPILFYAPYHDKRWLVQNQKYSGSGWTKRFGYYAKRLPATGLKAIYSFLNVGKHALGSRLTEIDAPYKGYEHLNLTFYVPDRSLYVGARYNKTTKEWYWNDGTKAKFTTKHSTCKQKAFQYEITDFENRNCTGRPAYYSCQLKNFSFTNIELESSNAVIVAAKEEIQNLAKLFGIVPNIMINLEEENGTKTTTATSNFQHTISNLEYLTKYEIQVEITFVGCREIKFCSRHIFTTGNEPTTTYSVTQAYTNVTQSAFVKTPSPCVVNLNGTFMKKNITSFKVCAKSDVALSCTNVTEFNKSTTEIAIDTKVHGIGNKIILTIRDTFEQYGGTEFKVQGHCINVTSTPSNLLLVLGVAVGIFVLMDVVLFGCLLFKRFFGRKLVQESFRAETEMGRTQNAAQNQSHASASYEIAVQGGYERPEPFQTNHEYEEFDACKQPELPYTNWESQMYMNVP